MFETDTQALRLAEKIIDALNEEDSDYIKGVGLSTAVGWFLLELTGSKAIALKGLKAVTEDAEAYIQNKSSDESGAIQ